MTFAVLIFAFGVIVMYEHRHRLLVQSYERERDQWTRERQLLLNRIKPETAQSIIDPEVPVQPEAVRFDDDEDYWRSTGPTKEELADALARSEC